MVLGIPDFLQTLSTSELLLLHLGISVIIALVCATLLKKRYHDTFLLLFSVILAINLLVPILGYGMSFFFVFFLLLVQSKQYLHSVDTFNQEEFYKHNFPHVKRIFGEGAIVNLATNTHNHSGNKMKGLVFMSQHPNKQNFSLIKGLLADTNNEIRLYSFSVLDNVENELNEKISQTLKRYDSSVDGTQKATQAANIAFYYWEFLYYGLNDKASNQMVLDKVRHYAHIALKKDVLKARLYALLGHCSFFEAQYHDAKKLFKMALLHGFKRSSLSPFLAEIAYNERDFKEVAPLLEEISPLTTSSLTAPLKALWIKT